jgi:hypothetical protein
MYHRNKIFVTEEIQKERTKRKRVDDESDTPGIYQIGNCHHLFKRLRKHRTRQEAINMVELELTAQCDKTDIPLGVRRLFRFLALLDVMGTFHWADVRFELNEQMLRRLVATHLILIVGKEEYAQHKTMLLNMIDRTLDLSKLVHVTWITNRMNCMANNIYIMRCIPLINNFLHGIWLIVNVCMVNNIYIMRCILLINNFLHGIWLIANVCMVSTGQNGKTTTLSRFLAALSIMGVNGGPMVYVYSISRDKAADVINGARDYINYAKTNDDVKILLAKYGIVVNPYTSSNQTSYSIRSSVNKDAVNHVRARPKGADSCRGDNPSACIFDEMGFLQADFWFV